LQRLASWVLAVGLALTLGALGLVGCGPREPQPSDEAEAIKEEAIRSVGGGKQSDDAGTPGQDVSGEGGV
jgi:hypothetical protein